MTTKILALTDALGNLVRFVLLPGHRYDTVGGRRCRGGVRFRRNRLDLAAGRQYRGELGFGTELARFRRGECLDRHGPHAATT